MPTRPHSREWCRERRVKLSPRIFFSRYRQGSWASGLSARKSMPHTGSKGLSSANLVCVSAQKVPLHDRVLRKLGKKKGQRGRLLPDRGPR